MRLLNQGRAQGLFTPSTSTSGMNVAGRQTLSPNPGGAASPFSAVSPTPPPIGGGPQQSLKRTRSESGDTPLNSQFSGESLSQSATVISLDDLNDVRMTDGSRPASAASGALDGEGPSPSKRARHESMPVLPLSNLQPPSRPSSQATTQPSSQPEPSRALLPTSLNGVVASSGAPNTASINGKHPASKTVSFAEEEHTVRFATKPSAPRTMDPATALKDPRRAHIISTICAQDDALPVLDLIREISPDIPSVSTTDIDLILDDQGHTALHLAASMARLNTVTTLLANGADMHRGNFLGETPLVRACLATHSSDAQTFHTLVSSLHPSIRTLDTSRKSVIHHIVALAGVKGRAVPARYYLDQILYWIAQHQGGDFRSLVDLQDEHGDTALNIAARVGNKSMVRTLLDVGANRVLPNKLGLRPGDFGVETEVGLHHDGILMRP